MNRKDEAISLAEDSNSPPLSPFMEAYLEGAGSGIELDLDPRIDLTKPIYEQARNLWLLDSAELTKDQDQ